MKVAPSIIAADFTKLSREIHDVKAAGADLLHLDIMDGVFVPNLTFGPMIVEAINRITDMTLDVHLMIANPEKYLGEYIEMGADWVSFHAEAGGKTDSCIRFIKEYRRKVGLAISPPTQFRTVHTYMERIDYLLIMTVNPGFYGQAFMDAVVKKIIEAKEWITKHKLRCFIEVDGGIGPDNVHEVQKAGADIVVAGASVFKSSDYRKTIEALRCSKV